MAADRPNHPAVEQDGLVVTYGALAGLARRWAAWFAGHRADRVLIALPQGPDAYAAMIGAILGGACYIPVNIASPVNKLARIVEAIQPDILVAEPALAARLAGAHFVADPADLPADRLEGAGQRHADAYVIMTSGSTGAPKGVVIPTGALAHYLDWLDAAAVFRPGDIVSQFPSIGFDLSVLDLFGALGAGATLAPATREADRLFPADFARRHKLSVWVSVPSAIELAMAARQVTAEMLGSVRLFAFCGEPLRRTHLAAIFAARPDATVLNLYGPTEATVSMTALPLRADDYEAACADAAALGTPIPGMGLRLLGGADPDEGEIVITGPQLARGYWRDPARTDRAFRALPDGARGYFTGDWGQRRDGQIFFAGRMDGQMKQRGHRIETGEILARLAECGYPVACVARHREALVVVIEAESVDQAAIRAQLFTELDAQAVPAAIRALARLPRTDNGKLDEAAVRAWLDGAGMG